MLGARRLEQQTLVEGVVPRDLAESVTIANSMEELKPSFCDQRFRAKLFQVNAKRPQLRRAKEAVLDNILRS